MRILVHEFETGGGARGGRASSASLVAEGAAMRAALLADLTVLPGVDVSVTADPGLGLATPPHVRLLPPVDGADDAFRSFVEEAEAVWLIAPETGGVLESLTAAVERVGRAVMGPSAAVIRRVSDKAWLAQHLAMRGVPMPPAPGDAGPVVIKPVRGAGCHGVSLARTRAEVIAARALVHDTAGGHALEQAYVDGVAASVSLVSDGRRAVPLAVNAQHVRPGRPFTYHGGETPLSHPLAGRAVERAVAVCAAVPGLVGYIGVDVVLSADDVTVVEINPRLTTAYVGLRRTLDVNVAGLVMAACAGDLPARAPTARSRVQW